MQALLTRGPDSSESPAEPPEMPTYDSKTRSNPSWLEFVLLITIFLNFPPRLCFSVKFIRLLKTLRPQKSESPPLVHQQNGYHSTSLPVIDRTYPWVAEAMEYCVGKPISSLNQGPGPNYQVFTSLVVLVAKFSLWMMILYD